jgi:formylglycine-generating enzyme required for sulfatase activity
MREQPPHNTDPARTDEAITPFDYSPPAATRAIRRHLRPREFGAGGALLLALLLAWFLLGARALELQVSPADAALDIDGGPSLRLGDRVLLHPGDYHVQAQAEGYQPLAHAFSVNRDSDQRLALRLEKLPGLLRLSTTPVAAQLQIDGKPAGTSNAKAIALGAGTHLLRLEADRYRAAEQSVEIEGMGREQALALALQPAWGSYRIVTTPPGATILHDGEILGSTPATVELLEGSRPLRITLAGYRDENITITAVAGESRDPDALALVRADARVQLLSRPEGASITLDGVYQGRTPLELTLESGKQHELIGFRAGYDRALRRLTTTQGTQQVVLELPPLHGEVQVNVAPPDAAIFSGSRQLATGSARLSLPATAQTLRVRREGYADGEVTVTPRPGFPQAVAVTLRTLEQQRQAALNTRLTSSAGQELVLLKPGPFRMGSSRREVGRRANEAIREIRLQRPYYLGLAEVTNAEFRQFRAAHSSGNFKGKSLNGDDQPAALVSWTDAALFCNWLSQRENLPPFYRVSGTAVTGADRASRGYRLPTEAEWAWAASMPASGPPPRYPWGEALPPAAKSGNYADRSGESLLGTVIAGYDDGFAVAAPVRRFTPNRHGLFDLGGNASEWVHDLYETAPAPGAAAETDPLGPDIGEFHVIRGASWRHGDVTSLRLAYRDYGKDGRADVGFRIARYAQ